MKKYIMIAVMVLLLLVGAGCGETSLGDGNQIDVDLTRLSSTMVYSEVSNMCQAPDKYLGKTVKMIGRFAVYPGNDRDYYACVIADATACCSQGIEFVLKDGNYPEADEIITVTGRFETYMEGTNMYIQLADAAWAEP